MHVLTCCLLAAINISLGELPTSEFADTEISTNIAVTAVRLGTPRQFTFVLSLDASPSNAVEVAIGADADDDGSLSVAESATTFGYDCGTWFCRDSATGRPEDLATVPAEIQASGSRIDRTFVLHHSKVQPNWNLVKVTRRGAARICDSTSVDGRVIGTMLLIK